MEKNVIEIEAGQVVKVEKIVGLLLQKPEGISWAIARKEWEHSIRRVALVAGLTDRQMEEEPFLTIKLSCGGGIIFDTFENIPNESIPCPCGNPKHWLLEVVELKEGGIQ